MYIGITHAFLLYSYCLLLYRRLAKIYHQIHMFAVYQAIAVVPQIQNYPMLALAALQMVAPVHQTLTYLILQSRILQLKILRFQTSVVLALAQPSVPLLTLSMPVIMSFPLPKWTLQVPLIETVGE